ncbi:MAG: D-glycerate dehydrogenase [Candidatus Paceibacterota bacterium]|jgi:glyoxylate reductase
MKKKKIYITRKIPEIAERMLKKKGYIVEINTKDKNLSKKELISKLKKGNYDAVLSLLSNKIDEDIFKIAPTVKIFANYATGFDNVDLEKAKKYKVVITNAPAPKTAESVAEHTFALMLALVKNITDGDRFVRAGKYKGWMPLLFIDNDLIGKNLGLIGAGRIGEKVAQKASALGLKIIYTDIKRNKFLEKKLGAKYYKSFKELLPKADFVSLHAPLLPSTYHLINKNTLKLMKKTAYIVNTSRGPVIDEKALVKALKNKEINGAGLDVYEFEPKVTKDLIKMENTVLTPHIASASFGARNEMAEICAQNIIDCLEGRKPKYQVN